MRSLLLAFLVALVGTAAHAAPLPPIAAVGMLIGPVLARAPTRPSWRRRYMRSASPISGLEESRPGAWERSETVGPVVD